MLARPNRWLPWIGRWGCLSCGDGPVVKRWLALLHGTRRPNIDCVGALEAAAVLLAYVWLVKKLRSRWRRIEESSGVRLAVHVP